jgi:hypothetical protein
MVRCYRVGVALGLIVRNGFQAPDVVNVVVVLAVDVRIRGFCQAQILAWICL